MRVDDFDFALPRELIATHPCEPRDAARLLFISASGRFEDRQIADLPILLRSGDLLVFNDTKVIPARLSGRRGEAVTEITLYRDLGGGSWRAFAKGARRLRAGDRLVFAEGFAADVAEKHPEGDVTLRFDLEAAAFHEMLARYGTMPLPPYIKRPKGGNPRDRADYQTIFARVEGAVAAPTAGLHFTPTLLDALASSGIGWTTLTLHVGPGTFLPVKVADPRDHRMHAEWGVLPAEAAERIVAAKRRGGRVVAVGTTSLRLLESAAADDGEVRGFAGETRLFIMPGYRFRAIDMLLTNFHLPRSTLLMLVAALAGLERIKSAYAHAVASGYRFFSYGDACLIENSGLDSLSAPGGGEGRGEVGGAAASNTGGTHLTLPVADATGPLPSPPASGRRGKNGWVAEVMSLGFEVLARDGAARRGRLSTAHGVIDTPVFMPVGTAGTVKAMTPEGVAATGARIVLGNTYHLMLRPGAERIAALGGLHRFMNWPYAILTDSGGFQVMSLAARRTITEPGVTFRSHLDGSLHELTPERSIEIQRMLGADITMALDECTPFPSPRETVESSMELTIRWAERSRRAFTERPGHNIFGIVQGGVHPELRLRSAARLIEIGFDGYAVGGLAIGEGQATTFAVLDVTVPALPENRPRYLMGVGKPADLVGAVTRGIDMFDCVLPTRSGRTAQAFTRSGTVNLRNARHADDPTPLDPECFCPACTCYSRAYLHHLSRAGEILGSMLLTTHNLQYYADLMATMRTAIEAGSLAALAADFESTP